MPFAQKYKTCGVRLKFGLCGDGADQASTGGEAEMAAKKKDKFSVTKAVKANARERVGQPKPGRLIEDDPGHKKAKHKEKLADLAEPERE